MADPETDGLERVDEALVNIEERLRFIGDTVAATLQVAQNEDTALAEVVLHVETTSDRLQTIIELGGSLVARTAEISQELRQYVPEAPEVPVFDEDIAFNVVLDFTRSNIGVPMTIDDVRAHLDEAGVVYPASKPEFTKLFKAWQDDVRLELVDERRDLMWITMPTVRKGAPRQYALAEIVKPKSLKLKPVRRPEAEAVTVSADTAVAEQVTSPDVNGVDVAPQNPSEQLSLSPEARVAFNIYTLDPDLHASGLYKKLAQLGGVDEDAAIAALKLVCRSLQGQGLVKMIQAKEGKSRPRAKRSTVLKVAISSIQMASGYKGDPQAFRVLIDSGESYEPEA